MDKAGESNVRSAHVRHTGRPADTANAALKNRLVRRPATTMDRVVWAVGVSTVDASRNDSYLAPVRAEMDDTQVIQSPRKFMVYLHCRGHTRKTSPLRSCVWWYFAAVLPLL